MTLPGWIYLFLLVPVGMLCLALAMRHFAKMYGPDGWRRWFVAQRESGRLFIVLGILVPLLYLGTMAVFSIPYGGSVLIRLLGQLPTACMLAAFQFLSLARRPVGDDLRCSKCKYPLAGLAPGSPSGPYGWHDARCPECGGQWGWPGGSVSTRKRWSRRWIAVAAFLFLPMILWFASIPLKGVLWWNRSMLVLAPNSSLVEEVLTQKSFTMDAWAELAGRTLSAHQTDRVARQLLSRASGAYFSSSETDWLSRTLAAQRVSRDLVEPRLARMFAVTARVGETSDQAFVDLKPVPSEFAPFQNYSKVAAPLLVVATVSTQDGGSAKPSSSAKLQTQGIEVFRSYSLGPVSVSDDGAERRLRATLTVRLVLPGPPSANTAGPSTPAGPEHLYQTDVPIDLPMPYRK